jgi:SH3-like domain-containing protein
MRYRVTKSWTTVYSDPITVNAGERLVLSGKEDMWEGHRWLWARSAAGKEGWVPDSLITAGPEGAIARSAYTAVELDCVVGDVLEAVDETHGWVMCRNPEGRAGWVPRSHLEATE